MVDGVEEPIQVKCADCGFLTVRDQDSRELIAAESAMRDSPTSYPQKWNAATQEFLPLHRVYPICYEQAYPLGAEMNKITVAQSNDTLALFIAFNRVIHKLRPCEQFVTWRQGATPQSHREMRDRERAQEREDQRDAEMRAREDRRDEKASTDRQIELYILGGFTILAAILGALVVVLSN